MACSRLGYSSSRGAHSGKRRSSDEEVGKKVASLTNDSFAASNRRAGGEYAMKMKDILFVAHYNFRSRSSGGARSRASVGSVDRFRGERLPSRSSPCAPRRGRVAERMEFLCSPVRSLAVYARPTLAFVVDRQSSLGNFPPSAKWSWRTCTRDHGESYGAYFVNVGKLSDHDEIPRSFQPISPSCKEKS